MPRHISFALATAQFLDGSKDVTRRMGWKDLRDGQILRPVEKGQGLKKGERVRRVGNANIHVSVRREPLRRMIDEPEYGRDECRREGFPDMTPEEFVAFFCRSHRNATRESEMARIEFEKIEG